MSNKVRFSNFSINNILASHLSILDRARIRLLYYGLILSFFILFALFVADLYQHNIILNITTGLLLVASAALFKYLTYWPRWVVISHLILIAGTVMNISDLYLSIQNVDVVSAEVMIMIMLFSFYMLGQKAGLIYTLLNAMPMLTLLLLQNNNSYVIGLKPEKVDGSTAFMAILAGFILLFFICSHFYNAFIKTIKELKETSYKQNLLTTGYEEAIKKAQKSAEAKSEFLSTMSHEIRTPLNAVIGMSNLLLSGDPRPDQEENLEVMKFSAANLLSIVNNVLDFNKIESGKLVFENIKFNLPELMQNICGGQIIAAQEKGLLFKLDVDNTLSDKVLFGDPTRLTQIIFNLVSNAVKYTSEGNIWVKVSCLEKRNNNVTVNFSVKDTGIGIAPDRLDIIFEPFTQESSSTMKQYEGVGLGLAIVKRLLRLQGLEINVSSRPSFGSRFSFDMEFPVSAEKVTCMGNERRQLVIENNETLSSIRMLVVEDNPINILLMKKILFGWNIVPSIAENGERAVELVQYGNFDIILMDLQMPVMNGFDATVAIRKMPDPKKSGIPIIALTASALFDIRERVLDSGMNDYVSKPFKPNELFEKIQNLISNPSADLNLSIAG